jgi:hypothetical protein
LTNDRCNYAASVNPGGHELNSTPQSLAGFYIHAPISGKPAMKSAFQMLARNNGAQARVKAARVPIILKMQTTRPDSARWLQQEAERHARSVDYHLRQAAVLGKMIRNIEAKEHASRRRRSSDR